MDFTDRGWHSEGVAAQLRRRWRLGVASAIVGIGLLASVAVSQAQVPPPITSSGLNTMVADPVAVNGGSQYNITGGTPRNSNLFHSFGRFSVGAGDIANFSNVEARAITNILGRVTGGDPSSIFGKIQTEGFNSANLFLINPAGWIFGPTASLNVGGSFHVSTANYLLFADGGIFSADDTPLPNNGLLATDPVAFGFLGPTGSISIEGSNLSVDREKTLSIVGGDVTIQEDPLTLAAPALTAPGGRIQIGSFASAGEATVDGLNGAFTSLGQVQISGGASISAVGDLRVDADGNPSVVNGGTVLIRGGQVDILGASLDASGVSPDVSGDPLLVTAGGAVVIRGGRLFADGSAIMTQTFGNDPGAPLGIDVQMDEWITLTNGTSLLTTTSGAGRGGDVRVKGGEGGEVIIDGSTIITASLGGEGVGGDVTIEGSTISLTGGSTTQSLLQSFAGAGRGGNITMSATDSASLGGGSGLFSVTDTAGSGGRIFVSAPSLTMDGALVLSIASFGEGPGGEPPGGTGGPIDIEVGRLSLTGGAGIKSQNSNTVPPELTPPGVSFQGGSVTVTVAGETSIVGPGSEISSIGFGAPPGDIVVDIGTLRLTDGALIQGGSFAGDSEGGNVTVRASESILIADGAGISSQALNLPVGGVEVSARSLTIDRGFINTGTLGVGRAGAISIDVGNLTLTRGGQIASSSIFTALGAGGDVTLRATESVTISGSSPDPVLPEPFRGFVEDTSSGVFSTASASGPGGNITIHAGQGVALTDGGVISARSTGTDTALAGNVDIIAGSLFRMANSTITTEAVVADGGNISITTTGSLLRLTDSQITTSVQSGVGQGGNITINSELIVLDGSRIRADAFGGPGGNITIVADVFLIQDSRGMVPANIKDVVTASSVLSQQGTISIQADITDVSGTLAQLPAGVLEAAALLRASCAARLAGGKTSTLVVAGREGLPLEPGGLLPSPLVSTGPAGAGRSGSEGDQWETLAAERYRLVAPSAVLDRWCSR